MAERDPFITYRYLDGGRLVEAQCSSAHRFIAAGEALPLEADADTYEAWCEASGEEAPDLGEVFRAESEDATDADTDAGEPSEVAEEAEEEADDEGEGATQAEGETKATRPEDAETLPPGYELADGRGGYYGLIGPGGRVIEGPSNGKHQGKDGAADAAWADYEA